MNTIKELDRYTYSLTIYKSGTMTDKTKTLALQIYKDKKKVDKRSKLVKELENKLENIIQYNQHIGKFTKQIKINSDINTLLEVKSIIEDVLNNYYNLNGKFINELN